LLVPALITSSLVEASNLPHLHVFTARIAAAAGGFIADGDASLEVPPFGTSGDASIEVTDEQGGVPPAPGDAPAVPAGDPYDFAIEGAATQKPMVLTLPVTPTSAPSSDSILFAAYYDAAHGQWVPVEAQFDQGESLLRVQTRHASWWRPWRWDVRALRDRVNRALVSLARSLGVAAYPLQCAAADPQVTLVPPDTVQACYESASSGPGLLRVVDNRLYGLLIAAPEGIVRGQVVRGGLKDKLWQRFLGLVGKEVTFVPSLEEVDFRVPGKGAWSFDVRPSVLTFGLDVLVTVARSVVPGIDLINAGLDAVDCLHAGIETDSAIRGAMELNLELSTPLINLAFECLSQVAQAAPVVSLIAQVRSGVTHAISLAQLLRDMRLNHLLQLTLP